MRAGAGLSTLLDPLAAIREATSAATVQIGPEAVDFALVLVSAAHGDRIPELAKLANRVLGTDAVLGVSVEGVIGAGVEVADNPAVAVLALSGYEVIPFLIGDLAGDEAAAGAELAAQIGGSLSQHDLVVLLPDPLRFRPERLLEGLEECLAPARVVGGAAGAIGNGPSVAWCGDQFVRGGLAGFVLRAERSAHVAVTQACQPVTPPLEVTRSRGNWIYSLAGRPALEVYREAARGPLAEDLERASRFLMVAIAESRADTLDLAGGREDFVVRHVVGFDEKRGAISLPRPVASGASVQLTMLDPIAARGDLGATLDAAPSAPDFGLYFNCRARGEALFGVSGLEAGYLERSYGDAPILGMFGAFQIAPRCRSLDRPGDQRGSQLLTYAGVLTLLS